jgi:hypothetical protein
MRLYLAIVYIRRLKKAGYFGEEKEKKYGTTGDFVRLFGSEVKD